MQNTTTLFSMFSLALFLLLATPQARAATANTCQDGSAATIDGKVVGVSSVKTGFWLFIQSPSWDCDHFFVFVKDKSTCIRGSSIHVSGVLVKHDHELPRGWTVSDTKPASGLAYDSSVSCN